MKTETKNFALCGLTIVLGLGIPIILTKKNIDDNAQRRPAYASGYVKMRGYSCDDFTEDFWVKEHGFNKEECEQHLQKPKFKYGQKAVLSRNPDQFYEKDVLVTVLEPEYRFYGKSPVKTYRVLVKGEEEVVLIKEQDLKAIAKLQTKDSFGF